LLHQRRLRGKPANIHGGNAEDAVQFSFGGQTNEIFFRIVFFRIHHFLRLLWPCPDHDGDEEQPPGGIDKLAREACDSAGKERLKKAQLAWIKYRDLCCEAEASIYEGGSLYGLAYTNCMIALTKERTGRLRVYDVESSWK